MPLILGQTSTPSIRLVLPATDNYSVQYVAKNLFATAAIGGPLLVRQIICTVSDVLERASRYAKAVAHVRNSKQFHVYDIYFV